MSADMFQKASPANATTKIPVPSSPIPFRRQTSLRMKGEKAQSHAPNHTPTAAFSRETNHRGRTANVDGRFSVKNSQFSEGDQLKRGRSYAELRERKSVVASKHAGSVKIEPRSGQGALRGPTTPESPTRVRSLSLSLSNTRLQSNPKSPLVVTSTPSNPISSDGRIYSTSHLDRWDTDSITSIGSSVASCDHASIARNGTTFSGRSMKYVFHCNQHAGSTGDDYLTPTQRAQKQVKKLKYLLQQAKKDLDEKDSDILKLTKEVVELRLYKAALNSPEDKSNSSDAVTVRENTSEDTTPEDLVDNAVSHITNEFSNSCADSGHFEDCASSSVHSKDSVLFDEHRSPAKTKSVENCHKSTLTTFGSLDQDAEHSRLIMEYEKRLQELVRTHEEETYQLKQKHNDKIEELLQRITEINERYWQLVPELDIAKDRIKELEQKLEEASNKLEEQEKKAQETYLKMYAQGHEAAKIERESTIVELAHQNPSRVSVPELLQELQVTKNELENIKDVEYASTSNNLQPLLSAKEALSLWVLGARKAMYRQLMEAKSKNKIDPEITLQFLKSAIYYFLTDKENSQGHLKAIQSILGFSPSEILNIDKARLT